MFHIYFHLVVCVDCLVFGQDTVCSIFSRWLNRQFHCSYMCVAPSAVLRNWCLVGMLGHVGHFLFQHLFMQ